MKGVESRLDYLGQCNVNYIHLMPFLETPEGRSDGGYAVSDFRKVQEKLGSMDLASSNQVKFPGAVVGKT